MQKIIFLLLVALCLAHAANPSGKAWLSGYTTDSGTIGDFASFRGAPQDIAGTWHCHQDWGFIEAGGCRNYMGGKPDAGLDGPLNWGWSKTKPQWHAVGLLPSDFKTNLLACSQGKYDSHFQKLGQSLVDADLNRANVFLRLGWEGNGDWYPWGAAKHSSDYFKNNAQRTPENYAGCFRKAVTAIRSKAKNVKISWNPNKDGGADELKMYPGDGYVDIVDVDYYNGNPLSTSLSVFNSHTTAKYSGDTIGRGIKLWLEFARAHGKKLAVSEWGANQGDYAGYIEGMHTFFKANAARIAWESYYNQRPSGHYNYRLFEKSGGKPNPNSAAKYKALWKKPATRSVEDETADDDFFDPASLELAAEDYLYDEAYLDAFDAEFPDHAINDPSVPHEADEATDDVDEQALEGEVVDREYYEQATEEQVVNYDFYEQAAEEQEQREEVTDNDYYEQAAQEQAPEHDFYDEVREEVQEEVPQVVLDDAFFQVAQEESAEAPEEFVEQEFSVEEVQEEVTEDAILGDAFFEAAQEESAEEEAQFEQQEFVVEETQEEVTEDAILGDAFFEVAQEEPVEEVAPEEYVDQEFVVDEVQEEVQERVQEEVAEVPVEEFYAEEIAN